jgi:hypothetical protein
MKRSHLVTSAMLGILAGAACAGSQPAPATPASGGQLSDAKNGCGNHPRGACGAPDETKAPSPAAASGPLSVARTETVGPGEHVEINLTFASASPAKATFKASGPVGWNVHSHPHGEMMVHEKGAGANGEISFQPPAPGTYSFLWTNDGAAPVTLEVKISADQGVSERKR